MSIDETTALSRNDENHRTILIVIGVVLVTLLVVMYVTWDRNRATAEARDKATELIAAYTDAGIETSLDVDAVADVYGTDGGDVCRIATDKTMQGNVRSWLGVGGGFYFRASGLDEVAINSSRIVAEVYCPEKLADLDTFIAELKLEETIND